MLIVHKLLQDEEENLGNVFQESEFLIGCHWRSGNLFQCAPSLCIGIMRISVVSCPSATWHSVGIRACQQRDCLQCGNAEVQHRKLEVVACCVMASKSKLGRSERENKRQKVN